MYYLIYGLFYLLSLLPWRVLYLFSDGVYLFIYHVIGYRREVVFKNLAIAFPEKTGEERKQIAKKFYHNFTDNFIETIKLLSITEQQLRKRLTSNMEVLNDLYATGQSVQIVTGHFFNWEFANVGVGLNSRYPFLVVYMPVTNKIFDRLVYQLRTRFGTLLIPATEFTSHFPKYAKNSYALILVADQNPGAPDKAYWVDFFGRTAPLYADRKKGAKRNDTALIYAHFYKVKRGYYHIQFELVTTDPKSYEDGALTKLLVGKVEDSVRRIPDNYLWSHRRWKFEYDEMKYGRLKVK